jgi:hypothetical protein
MVQWMSALDIQNELEEENKICWADANASASAIAAHRRALKCNGQPSCPFRAATRPREAANPPRTEYPMTRSLLLPGLVACVALTLKIIVNAARG